MIVVGIIIAIIVVLAGTSLIWDWPLKLGNSSSTTVPDEPSGQPQPPVPTPCEVCGTDPNLAILPECKDCPLPEMPPVNGNVPPIEIPELTGCARFVGIPPASVKFPKTPDGVNDNPNWTITFWVKIKNMHAPEFTLMKKGSSNIGASPAIVFGKSPGSHPDPCIRFNFNTPGSPGIMTIDPDGVDVPARPPGSFSSLCPNFNRLPDDAWKFFAWTQKGPEMTFYDGSYIWMYSPNTPLTYSQGNLIFSDGNGAAEIKNVSVCNRALDQYEITQIYQRESMSTNPFSSFGGPGQLTSQRPPNITPSGLFKPSLPPPIGRRPINPYLPPLMYRQPTKTFVKKGEGISGTFYKLIEVENYTPERNAALMRSFTALTRQ